MKYSYLGKYPIIAELDSEFGINFDAEFEMIGMNEERIL